MYGYELDSIHSTLDKLEDLNQIDYNKLDSTLKWNYNMAKASYMGHLSHSKDSSLNYKDSISFYLLRAIEFEPKQDQTAKIISIGYRGHKRALSRGTFTKSQKWHYFLEDVPNVDIEGFLLEWSIRFPFGPDGNNEKLNPLLSDTMISDLLIDIYLSDQEVRGNLPLDFELMRNTDSINRTRVDSIYEANENLGELSEGERSIISLVLHHSEDWAWNKKWFDRLLCGRMAGLSHGPILSLALERHLFPSKSMFKNESDFNEFLDYLIVQYPNEAEEYNFKYYKQK